MKAVVRRVIDAKFGVWKGSTEYMGPLSRWVKDIADARVFTHAGHAKNAIQHRIKPWRHRYVPADDVHYFVVPVRVEMVPIDDEPKEYKP